MVLFSFSNGFCLYLDESTMYSLSLLRLRLVALSRTRFAVPSLGLCPDRLHPVPLEPAGFPCYSLSELNLCLALRGRNTLYEDSYTLSLFTPRVPDRRCFATPYLALVVTST
jgi:hypothetical protein